MNGSAARGAVRRARVATVAYGGEGLLQRMTREMGEIGAGMRDPARPMSYDDGELFSVRMVGDDPAVSVRG